MPVFRVKEHSKDYGKMTCCVDRYSLENKTFVWSHIEEQLEEVFEKL